MNKIFNLSKVLLFFIFISKCHVAEALGFTMPTGHREAFMANTGGTLLGSPGNVIYNPAGLGYRDSSKSSLSVSGNTLSTSEISFENLNGPNKETGVRSMLVASVFPTDWGTGSFFMTNPIFLKNGSKLEGKFNDTVMNSELWLEINQIQLGSGFGKKINQNLSLGLSAGIGLLDVSSYTYSKGSQTGLTYSVFNRNQEGIKDFFLISGIIYQPTKWWTLGLTFELIPLIIDSKAISKSKIMNSVTPTVITESTTAYDLNYSPPKVIRLSQSFNINDNNRIYFDVVNESETSKDSLDGVKNIDKENWLYNVGLRNYSMKDLGILLGHSQNKKEFQDYQLFTAGVITSNQKNEIIIGAFYLEIKPTIAGGTSLKNYGIMVSSDLIY